MSRNHTRECGIPARESLVEWLPLAAAFLFGFHHVALDLVASVVLWFAPGESHRVLVNVVNFWLTGGTRFV